MHSRARVFRDQNGFRSRNLLNCSRARSKSAIQKSIFHFQSQSATKPREQNSATESRRQPTSLGKCQGTAKRLDYYVEITNRE